MRVKILIALTTLAFFSSPCRALEKTSHAFNDAEGLEWRSACEAILTYFNICTGWTWAWSGFEPGERVGVTFGPLVPLCDVGNEVHQTAVLTPTTIPPGYGYTGTISIHPADSNMCPRYPAYASQAFFPTQFYTLHNWGPLLISPLGFVVVVTFPNTPGNPMGLVSDRPSAGPTGPAACGVCYPSNRLIHSYRYGPLAAPLCPGVAFDDGTCRAELTWQVLATSRFLVPTSVEGVDTATWGSIKSLYR